MINGSRITGIQIVPVKPNPAGIVSFAAFNWDNSFYMGSIAIRRNKAGDLYLSYPSRKVGDQNYTIFHPINKPIANQINEAVMREFKGAYSVLLGDHTTDEYDSRDLISLYGE